MGIRLDGTTDTISAPGSDLNLGQSGDSVKVASAVQLPTAGPLSNRNLVINGAMNVAQRGTSSTSSGLNTIDRFAAQWAQGAVTQSQEDLTTGSPFDSGFSHFFRLKNTTASTAAAAYREITYKFEGQDIGNSGWTYKSSSSYITLSFWARASVSQNYYAFVESRVSGNRIYSFPFTLAADTWTYVTETIPGDSSMSVGNDASLGFIVDFVPFYGTTYTDSSNSDRTWRDRSGAGDYMLDMTNTWANTTNATFDITGVQLEVGEKATPFEHRSFGYDLARCQRYFYAYELLGVTLVGGNTALCNGSVYFPVKMRAAPTLTSTSVDRMTNIGEANHNGSYTFGSYIAEKTHCAINYSRSSGDTWNQGTPLSINDTGGSTIMNATAEL